MAHHHLDRRGQRDGATGVDDHLYLCLIQGGAVDVGGVGAEEAGLSELLHLPVQAIATDSDMGRDARVRLPSELPVIAGHLEVGELRAGGGKRQRQQLVLGGEVLGGRSHKPARLTLLPLAPPGKAIGEDGAEPGVLECLDHGVGVRRRSLDV